jgi:hypothetical protein
MKKIIITESQLKKVIKSLTIKEQPVLGLADVLADPSNTGLNVPGSDDGTTGDIEYKKDVLNLFTECRRMGDNQLNLNNNRNIQLFNNLYNQIQGLSKPTNTVNVLKQIKNKNEFCAVDRLFSKQKKQDLFKELDSEWGLTWGNIVDGLKSFITITSKSSYSDIQA